MEIFNRYKIVILRTVGALMLLLGFVVHFWSMPQEGMSENERAAANIARMEAKVAGKSIISKQKKDDSKFLNKLQHTQAKQLEYLAIIAMLFGVGFLGYSFIKKSE